MKKMLLVLSILSAAGFTSLSARCHETDGQFQNDLTGNIPVVEVTDPNFEKVPDVAQYGAADWSQVVGIVHNASLMEAFDIASKNDSITYFFYMKGGRMVIGSKEEGSYRAFYHGDAVFFSGTPWWGSAEGYSDGYVKGSILKRWKNDY